MRILVVEDEHRIANTIKEGLKEERYAVDVAYDGIYGFDLASTEEYDLIVLDLMLPGIDGFEICRRLRLKQNHTPILILTARGQISDKVTGLDAGADDYLTKPFSFEELLARVRALMRRPKNSTKTMFTVEDLMLDPKNFIVKRGKQNIKLTRKEFSLLEFLMRNTPRIINKDQIRNHVWNYDDDILPNTVEVYIRLLRGKIDRSFKDKKPLIHTERGFGYKIGG